LSLNSKNNDHRHPSLSRFSQDNEECRVEQCGGSNHSMLVLISLVISMIISCAPAIHYQPLVNDPLVIDQNGGDQISILTYNIQTIFGKDESKLQSLLDYVNTQQFDFVLFQELFDESVRDYVVSHIDNEVYQSIVSRIDYNTFPEMLFQDAGLFLMSKYPQIDLSTIRFDDQVSVSEGAIHMNLNKEISLSTDFLANKSIMGSLHQINDSTQLFIFTTHVQALGSRSHKREQFRQIKDFIEYATYAVLKTGTVNSAEDLIVLLTGDFNTDAYDEGRSKILLQELGSPRDLHKELYPAKKEYTMMFKLFNMFKRFDYIFAYDGLEKLTFRRVSIQSINATDVKDNRDDSMSDHLGLKASIQLNPITIGSAQFQRDAK
jgi:endonuclease/exonuclease/phosphatase family metal-dependent hydrolase